MVGRGGGAMNKGQLVQGPVGAWEGLGFTPKSSGQLWKTSLQLPTRFLLSDVPLRQVFGALPSLGHSDAWLSDHLSVVNF